MNRDELRERIESVRARVAAAASRAGRPPEDVLILPVTKGHPPDVLETVVELGFPRVGENRVDEAERKRAALGNLRAQWHMVGHLQRNKAGRAVELFDVVESVDSLRLARRLDEEVGRAGRDPIPVLVQVNASGEASKSGFAVEEAPGPFRDICGLPGLRVLGLMTMAPYTEEEAVLRRTFARTRECLARCRDAVDSFDGSVLSMGMSNDFEIAVEEGSTELRLGTVLLGERPDR